MTFVAYRVGRSIEPLCVGAAPHEPVPGDALHRHRHFGHHPRQAGHQRRQAPAGREGGGGAASHTSRMSMNTVDNLVASRGADPCHS